MTFQIDYYTKFMIQVERHRGVFHYYPFGIEELIERIKNNPNSRRIEGLEDESYEFKTTNGLATIRNTEPPISFSAASKEHLALLALDNMAIFDPTKIIESE